MIALSPNSKTNKEKLSINTKEMKRIILFIAFVACSVLTVSAQGQRIFLFDNFAKGLVTFKNKAVSASFMNYDANNGKMYFKQGDELMELTNAAAVDSIKFGERKFLGYKNDFVELFQLNHGEVRILWRIHKVHEGYEGAFGTISQVGGQKIQLQGNFGMGGIAGAGGGMYNGSFGLNTDDGNNRRLDIWRQKSANTYMFAKNDKEYAVKSLKNIYKQLPEYQEQIKAFVKENSLDMMSADKAIMIIDYILSL